MQASKVATNNQIITSSQSLQVIKTLLQASLGCITYLRGLLPVDNFNNSYLMSSSHSSSEISENGLQRRDTSGMKIMTVKRGFTDEADKLLNFLEQGVYDALEKRYLRSCIFGVYLDNKDPTNVVETYSFNFKYYNIPGSNTVVPIMSLGEDLANMSLSVPGTSPNVKAPTVGDVKKSVKALIKRLITATTPMEQLPKQRYATFKLFYYDHTPSDYEPPYFRPGDEDKDKWTFATHDQSEVPERNNIGQIKTPWHGVTLRIASVAPYLPSSTARDSDVFSGNISTVPGIHLTPIQEAALHQQQTDALRKDAEERNVIWAVVDDPDADAEGEDDPDYANTNESGTFGNAGGSGVEPAVPLGIRNSCGEMEPLPRKEGEETEVLFRGISETVPNRVGQLLDQKNADEMDQTQRLEFTQDANLLASHSTLVASAVNFQSPNNSPLPSSNVDQSLQSVMDRSSPEVDTLVLKTDMMDMMNTVSRELSDTEMLDMETQAVGIVATSTIPDSIESFGIGKSMQSEISAVKVKQKSSDKSQDVIDNGLDCECGIGIEDECCFCDGGCGHWYHIWCMGFHSVKDERIPSSFTCFDCRVRSDQNWDLIAHDLYPEFLAKFRLLALFRRAIKITENFEPPNISAFAKFIGCEISLATQLFNRLETEGFVALESMVADDLGLLSTKSHTAKRNHKKKDHRRKNLQKTKYIFVASSKKTVAYADYFNPEPMVENRIMGLSQLTEKLLRTASRNRAMAGITETIPNDSIESVGHNASLHDQIQESSGYESQTQEETQLPAFGDLKRKLSAVVDINLAKKKVKISVGPAVDLGD